MSSYEQLICSETTNCCLNSMKKALAFCSYIPFASYSRIRNNKNANADQAGAGGTSCVKMRHMGHNDNISLPDSVIETSKPVKLKDFSEHYRIMSADSDFRFSEEYEELKHVGREKPCSAADMPVNRPKNRYGPLYKCYLISPFHST